MNAIRVPVSRSAVTVRTRRMAKRALAVCKAEGGERHNAVSRRSAMVHGILVTPLWLVAAPALAAGRKSGPVVLTKAQMMEQRRQERLAAMKEKMAKVKESKEYTVE